MVPRPFPTVSAPKPRVLSQWAGHWDWYVCGGRTGVGEGWWRLRFSSLGSGPPAGRKHVWRPPVAGTDLALPQCQCCRREKMKNGRSHAVSLSFVSCPSELQVCVCSEAPLCPQDRDREFDLEHSSSPCPVLAGGGGQSSPLQTSLVSSHTPSSTSSPQRFLPKQGRRAPVWASGLA